MSRLEDELRTALRREQPPAGFAQRVLARAAQPRRSVWDWIRWPAFRWAVAGAMALIMVVALLQYRHRARGEAAKQQVMLALRITSSKLKLARQRVHQIQGPAFTEKQQ